jgi:hypothetical protein
MNQPRLHAARAATVIAVLLSTIAALAQQPAASPSGAVSAAARMAEPGPEARELARQTGLWDVVATIWPAPDAPPVVTRGLVAERNMIGLYLQEVMRPAPGADVPDFRRLDYLNFDRVEGRWKYVSMDTRMPVSIMPAWSMGAARDGKLTLQFAPQAFVGFGQEVEGRFMVSDMVLSQTDADRLLKQQHVSMANGTGKTWLFVQYEYTRRR